MLIVVVVALSVLMARRLWWPLLILAVWFNPIVGVVGAVAWVVYQRIEKRAPSLTPSDEAQFCTAMASELRAGSPLRSALCESLVRFPGLETDQVQRRVAAGLPLAGTAEFLREALPLNGCLVATSLRLAGSSGGRAAPLFETLADRAVAEAALRREQRALTAQARLSAFVIGGLPLVATTLMLVTGRLAPLLAVGRLGATVLVVGAALQLAGLGVMALLMRGGST